jgi:hypothetical protein
MRLLQYLNFAADYGYNNFNTLLPFAIGIKIRLGVRSQFFYLLVLYVISILAFYILT